jgi:hypothetical protein
VADAAHSLRRTVHRKRFTGAGSEA